MMYSRSGLQVTVGVAFGLLGNIALADGHETKKELEIYGLVEFRSVDRDGSDIDSFLDAARLGVKGTHPFENTKDLAASWQIEYNLPVNSLGSDAEDTGDAAVRQAHINVHGGFGQLIVGRQNNGVVYTKKMDQFKFESGVFLRAPDRVGNAISYVTPSFSGVELYGQAIMDAFADEDTGVQSDDIDGSSIGFNYNSGDVYVGATRFEVDELYAGTQDLTSLGFQVGMGDFALFGTFQDDSDADFSYEGLGVSYARDHWTYKVGYSQFEEGDADEGAAVTLLVDRALADGVNAYIQYIDFDSDAEDGGFGSDNICIGIAATMSKVFGY